MKTLYNKLVRNNIPEIIEKSGKKANYRNLSNEEFYRALKVKLVEEATELVNAKTPEEEIEELADIYEVLMFMPHTKDEILKVAFKKRMNKGWFSKHVFLESVEDDESEES